MVIAGVVVETLPGRAADVARRLAALAGCDVQGSDGHTRLAVVWRADDGNALVTRAEDLVRGDPDVVGVFPTFVGQDEEEAAPAAAPPPAS